MGLLPCVFVGLLSLGAIFAPLSTLLHHFSPLACHYYTLEAKTNQVFFYNFFEKISVFPFYPVKFRLYLPFPIPICCCFYYFIYNFYLFPFLGRKIRPCFSNKSIFFAYFPFPCLIGRIKCHSLIFMGFHLGSEERIGFLTRVNSERRALPSKGIRG
jgi:hypothetical protein